MRDLGFKGRPLTLGSFGHETRRIATAGITYGLRDRVVRFIMLATLVQGIFFIYGFYSWQKYFLDLLGQDLVWVTRRHRRAASGSRRSSATPWWDVSPSGSPTAGSS